MFKRYRFQFNRGRGPDETVDFYVGLKKTKAGNMYRACCMGSIPRMDDGLEDMAKWERNCARLVKLRRYACKYSMLDHGLYPGQICLAKLWDRLSSARFVDMSVISKLNPFRSDSEPDHDDLPEPEEILGRHGDAEGRS